MLLKVVLAAWRPRSKKPELLVALEAVLGASWGRLGSLERALGAVLGASWGRLGGLERALEALGGQDQKKMRTFGGTWGFLGCLLGPSWRLDRRLGRSWGRLGPSKNPYQNRSKHQCL